MKRTITILLALVMILSLAACDARRLVQGSVSAESGAAPASAPEGTPAPVSTDAPESPPAPTAEPEAETPAYPPADEYGRAIWYGFVPDELAQADPDATTVTWAQYCEMLGRIIVAYDESALPEWESMTKDAPDTEMKRDGAAVALVFAAHHIGLDWYNLSPHDRYSESYDWGAHFTADYPVFDWDTAFPLRDDFMGGACDTSNAIAPAFWYLLGRASALTGETLLVIENGDPHLDEPFTLRDAALSALRLYESEIPYILDRIPTAEDAEFLAKAEARKQAILDSETAVTYTGTAYYVSNDGSDENDGLSPQTAWATLERVRQAKDDGALRAGDAVFFERGGLWRGYIDCAEGVTYSAYGEGEKPRIYGSPMNGTGAENWELWHDEGGVKIWTFVPAISEVGNIVLNDGAECAYRVYAFYNGEEWVVSGADQRPFDVVENLRFDMQFYSTFDMPKSLYEKYLRDYGGMTVFADQIDTTGTLYLRCDRGNPGELYESIEFQCAPDGLDGYIGLVTPSGNNVIDNLCIRYCVVNGIAIYGEGDSQLGNDNNIIQNCEIGWMGGDQHDFNREGGDVMVCGESIVFKTDNNIIRNNYVYQGAQATFTSEFIEEEWTRGEPKSTGNRIEGNLAEYGQYGFYFWDNSWRSDGVNARPVDMVLWEDTYITDNYMLYMGYGWHSDERMSYPGKVESEDGTVENSWAFGVGGLSTGIQNMRVENNVFYLSRGNYLVQVLEMGEELQNVTFSGNTYVQNDNRDMLWGDVSNVITAEGILRDIQFYLKDEEAVVFPVVVVR